MTPRRLAWPLPATTLAVPAVAVALVAFALTIPNFGWRSEWQVASALAHEHLSLVGPLAAATAFHRWALLADPGKLFAAARLAGTDRPEHWAGFLRVWLVLGVAYTAGLVPIFVHTAANATYGGPALGPIVAGYLGLGFTIAVGQLLAALVPVPVLSVVAALVVFLLLQLPQTVDRSFSAVLPVQWHELYLNESENPTALLFRIIALTALTAALVGASRIVGRADRRVAVTPASAGAVGLLVLLLAVAAVNPPTRIRQDAAPPAECVPAAGLRVCAHPGHRADLAPMAETTAALVAAYGAAPPGITAVRDAATLPPGPPPPGVVAVPLALDQPADRAVATDLADAMAGARACARKSRGDAVGSDVDTNRAYELSQWLLREAGLQTPDQPWTPAPGSFFDRPAAEVRAWLAEHGAAIVRCDYPRPAA